MTLVRNYTLKPCTIIPSELYVEREADRQLARILNDMGRPGYVLVARQMGKTNLLLNARRSMAGGPDKFVYLDVSNFVPDLRAFFRAVIDTCLDSFPGAFDDAASKIEFRRNSARLLLEHKEHELELRDVLQASGGRIIICLDEIDALTKTGYSDQVFSLIRSIYFSGRTNFSEFSKLTYVLSGVAEPTEIIKNRSISPFNIGEKIYLEDFKWEEFCSFLRKAGLDIKEDVARHIYAWTMGNPRMTWDLCSAVERVDGELTTNLVDELVDKLYLSTFDLPPVDHIRTLAQTDKEVRSAVMEIHYGKVDSISDQIKNRLYLSGIISAPVPSAPVRIKNRIIEAALSEKWIEDIERNEQSTLDHANALFAEQRYRDALFAYEECEVDGTIGDADLFAFRKGTCQYFAKDYNGALSTFTSQPFPKSRSVDFYVAGLSKTANALLLLNRLEESIAVFEKLITELGTSEDQPLSFYQAQLNLSSAYLALSPPRTERTKELCESVITAIASSTGADITPEMRERYQCFSYFNIHAAELKNGNRATARAAIDKAIGHASRSDRATLALERAREFELGSARVDAIIECANYCVSNCVSISSAPDAERPLAFSIHHAASLVLELELGGSRSAEALAGYLDHCIDVQANHEASANSIIVLAANHAFSQRRTNTGLKLYSDGARISRHSEDPDYWKLLSFNLAICPMEEFLEYRNEFALHLISSGSEPEGPAVRVVHRVVQTLINDGLASEANELLNAIGVRSLNLSQAFTFEDLVTQFYRLGTDAAIGVGEDLNLQARKLFNAISSYSGPPPRFYPGDFRQFLLGQLIDLCPDEFSPKTMQRCGPKFGRNEVITVKHLDGSTESGKYKRFEALLRDEKVTIVLN